MKKLLLILSLSCTSLFGATNTNYMWSITNTYAHFPVLAAGTNITIVTNITGAGGPFYTGRVYTVSATNGPLYFTNITPVFFLVTNLTVDQQIANGASMQNITNLIVNVDPAKYVFKAVIGRRNSAGSPSETLSFDFGNSSATIPGLDHMRISGFSFQGDTTGATSGMGIARSLSEVLPASGGDLNGGNTNTVTLEGMINVTSGGTLGLRVKRNNGTTDNVFIQQNSYMYLLRMPF